MFAIYDVQGRRFRSTLEHLQKVRATQASHRASLRSDGGEQALQNLAEQTVGRTADHHPVSYNARQAYLDVLHIKEREAVVHAYQLMSHPVVTVPLALDIPVAWQDRRRRHDRGGDHRRSGYGRAPYRARDADLPPERHTRRRRAGCTDRTGVAQ